MIPLINRYKNEDVPILGGLNQTYHIIRHIYQRPIAVPSCLIRPITMRMTNDMTEIVEKEGILGEKIYPIESSSIRGYILGNLQFGFRPDHCTQDAIYVLSTLIQNCKASRSPYHAVFIDISKVKSW